MATIIYEYFRLQNKYFQIPITATVNTSIRCYNAGMITTNGDNNPVLFCIGNEWDNSTLSVRNLNNSNLHGHFGNGIYEGSFGINYGSRYTIGLNKNSFNIGGNYSALFATQVSSSNKPLTIGAGNDTNSDNVIHMMDGYVGDFCIYDDNVLVMELKPAKDRSNGQYCYYDTISDTCYYAQGPGTIEGVNPFHTFTASTSKLSYQAVASSKNIIVTAETGWTATTNNNWITLPENTGTSGDTNVTITVDDGSYDSSRVGKVTFTDDDNFTFDVDINQKKLGLKVYSNRYKVGSTSINKQQRGNDNVNRMYMGNDLVYQKLSFAPTLSINVDSIEFKCSGDTAQTVTVNSNTNWNYTTDVNWLTLTKDGNTLSVLPDDYTSELENRTATITITADNGDIVKTKTISVTQKKVTFWEPVDYVYTTTDAFVNTSIVPTVNTKFRVKLKQTGTYGGTIVGYGSSWGGETPIACENDNTDYRYFNHNGPTTCVFDFNNSRIGPLGLTYDANGLYDLTFGNNYIHDNVANTERTGSTQSSIATQRNVPIFINLSTSHAQIQQVTIYDNDVVVFDGYAADVDSDYGIYDTVSETLLKPTNGATVYKGTW